MNYSANVEKASSTFISLPMDSFLAAHLLVCNLIGLPLNLLTAAYIVFKPHLHNSRNIIWLGVAFSNVLILLHHLVEAYAHHFRSETAKNIFKLVVGLPYASLTLNLFLSLVDRYVSITHSAWYKSHVSINWIVSGEICCFSILCIVMKGPYLIEIIQFSSKITTMELKIVTIVLFPTLLMCVIGYTLVYLKVKCYLRIEKEADAKLSTNRRAFTQKEQSTQTTEFVERELREDCLIDFHLQQATPPVQKLVVTPSPFYIQIGDYQEISRLELKAAHAALDSVTLFLLFVPPFFVTLNLTIHADYFPSFGILNNSPHCFNYLWTLTYTRILLLIYPVVNPILFAKRSRDLLQTLNLRR